MSTLHEVKTWIADELPRLIEKYDVPAAAVAVLADGEVVDDAAGVLSLATGVEATPDSVFQIGSITKLWTSTLVMQLVDEGKVDLDAPIRTYLPEFRILDESAAAQITTRQLLSHTAGFEGDIFTDTGLGDDAVEKYLGVLHEVPQLFAPGEQFSYNNAGFCVLGRLVEVLREKPYDACLREHLFAPLGLTHAATSPYEAIMFRAAVGHIEPEPGAGYRARPGLGAGPLERAGRRDARDAPPRPAGLRPDAHERRPGGRRHPGARPRHRGGDARPSGRPARPRHDGHLVGPRVRAVRHSRGRDHRSRRRHHRPVGLPAHRPRGRASRSRSLTNGGDIISLYRDVVGHVVEQLTDDPAPGASRCLRRTRSAIDAGRYVGTYSSEVADLTVSQDEDGRIWLEQTPKGIFKELGEKPERKELVHYQGDSLIPAEPEHGMHMPHAFVGDDGEGRALYLHVGRAVRRAGA